MSQDDGGTFLDRAMYQQDHADCAPAGPASRALDSQCRYCRQPRSTHVDYHCEARERAKALAHKHMGVA